jgi:hypothetical protein
MAGAGEFFVVCGVWSFLAGDRMVFTQTHDPPTFDRLRQHGAAGGAIRRSPLCR